MKRALIPLAFFAALPLSIIAAAPPATSPASQPAATQPAFAIENPRATVSRKQNTAAPKPLPNSLPEGTEIAADLSFADCLIVSAAHAPTLISFTDDLQTPLGNGLIPNPAPPDGYNPDPARQVFVQRDRKSCVISIVSAALPDPKATEIHARGTLKLTLGSGAKITPFPKFTLKLGAVIKTNDFSLIIQRITASPDPQFPQEYLEFRSDKPLDNLKTFQFFDGDTKIDAEARLGDKVIYVTLPHLTDTTTIKVSSFEQLRTIDLPFDVKAKIHP